MWSQPSNDERRGASFQSGPPRQAFPGGYQGHGPPSNPPPPQRAPPANPWGPPPPQQSSHGGGDQYYGNGDEDDGALGATINLVTSAASMFFKPPAPAPPPAQQASPALKPKGPPPPIDPTTSMLDMEPPAQPGHPMQAGAPAYPVASHGHGARFRPPSQPSTPSTERAPHGSAAFSASPRLFEPSSPKKLTASSPQVARRIANPQIPVPTLASVPSLPGHSKQPMPVALNAMPPTVPPLNINTASSPAVAADVFAFGSASSTPASTAGTPTAAAPPILSTPQGSMDAADVFGASSGPTFAPPASTTAQAPPKPASTQPPSIPASSRPPVMQPPNGKSSIQRATPPPSPKPQRDTGPPSQPPKGKSALQRATPPPSPKPQRDAVVPSSPRTPLTTNQTSSATKVTKKASPRIATSSPAHPTPTRRQLRAPPKAQISPRTTRPKFRLPPPRKKAATPSPRNSDKSKPPIGTSKPPTPTARESPPVTPRATPQAPPKVMASVPSPAFESGPPALPAMEHHKQESSSSSAAAVAVGRAVEAKPIEAEPALQEEATAPEVTAVPPTQETTATGLPEGWTELLDTSTGAERVYYYNTMTQETSWERPKEEPAERPSEPEITADFGADNNLAPKPAEPVSQAPPIDAAATQSAAVAEPPIPAPETEISREESIDSIFDELNAEFEDKKASNTEAEKSPTEPPKIDEPATEPQAAEETPAVLPPNWVEDFDSSSGRVYFYNTVTQETSWERPALEAIPVENAPVTEETAKSTLVESEEPEHHAEAKEEDVNPTLPENWVEVVDQSSGNVYYYNNVTQETSWEKPVPPVEFGDASAAPSLPESNEEDATEPAAMDFVPEQVVEPAADTAAEPVEPEPEHHFETTAPPTEPVIGDVAADVGTLPDGWVEVLDENSGATYYYHTISQTTSWERPVVTPETEDSAASPAVEKADEPALEVDEPAPEDIQGVSSTEEHDIIADGQPENLVAQNVGADAEKEEVAQASLPQDWIEAVDESSGQVYFYNTVTQETSWEKPVIALESDVVSDLPAAETEKETTPVEAAKAVDEGSTLEESDRPLDEPEKVESVAEGSTLPEDWVVVVDESSGQTYYYNTVTQETSWEIPPASPDSAIGTNVSAAEPENHPSPEEVPSGDSSGTFPDENGDAADEPEIVESAGPTSTDPATVDEGSPTQLPQDWVELVDESSGQTYYYNTVSQESSWERPAVNPQSDEAADAQVASAEELAPEELASSGHECVPPRENEVIADEPEKVETEAASEVTIGDEVSTEALPQDWIEAVDDDGRRYYYNTVTQETRWEKPFIASTAENEEDMISESKDEEPPETTHSLGVRNISPADLDTPVVDEPECVETDARSVDGGESSPMGPLPGDWVEVSDEASGQVYYYNTVTQETSWERPQPSTSDVPESTGTEAEENTSEPTAPVEAAEPMPSSIPESGKDSGEGQNILPPHWEEVVDEASGRVYYLNTVSQETSWEKPEIESKSATTPTVETDHDHVEEVSSVQERNEHNEIPEDMDAPPDDWIQLVDESTGREYYYNTVTQEASWEKPAGILPTSDSSERLAGEAPEEAAAVAETTLDLGDEVGQSSPGVSPNPLSPDAGEHPVAEDTGAVAQSAGEVVEKLCESEAEPSPPGHDKSVLPDNWEELTDESSGRVYYYNIVTQEASWDKPAQSAIADSAEKEVDEHGNVAQTSEVEDEVPVGEEDKSILGGGEPGLPDHREELVDESSGQAHNNNTFSQENPWEPALRSDAVDAATTDPLPGRDISEAPEGAPSECDENAPTPSLDECLPQNWEEIVDESSGQVYYYNALTQETSWDKPGISDTIEPVEYCSSDVVATDEDAVQADEFQSAPATLEAELPEGWEKVVNESSGEVYYYNATTEEKSWDKPHPAALEPTNQAGGKAADIPSVPAIAEPVDPDSDEVAAVDDMGTGEEELTMAVVDGELPEGWVEVVDESSGQVYYYNTMTQETSWEKPEVDLAATADSTQLLNDETNVATPGPAPLASLEECQENVEEEGAPSSDEANLPDCWEEMADESSGQIYYYNTVTQETSWDKPAAVAPETAHSGEPPSNECDKTVPVAVTDDSEVPTSEFEASSSAETELPENWVEGVDQASGQIYYYNTATQETCWEKPSLLSSPPALSDDCGEGAPEQVFNGVEEEPMDSEITDTVEGPSGSVLDASEEDHPASDQPQDAEELGDDDQLANDWIESVDEATGQIYYYNTVTQEASWDRPVLQSLTAIQTLEGDIAKEPSQADSADADGVENIRSEAEATQPSEKPNPNGSTAQDWVEAVDDTSGMTYYYNTVTEETSWERPAELDIVESSDDLVSEENRNDDTIDRPRAESKDEFLNEFDLTSGAEDKADSTADEGFADEYDATTDDDEEDFDMLSQNGDTPETEGGNVKAAYELPEFWTEAVDGASGREYYFNSLTQEVSWERPTNNQSHEEKRSAPESENIPQGARPSAEDLTVPGQPDSNSDLLQADTDLPVDDSPLVPEGWTEVIDESTGKPYYLNQTTGETSWEIPQVQNTEAIHDGWVDLNQDSGFKGQETKSAKSRMGETLGKILASEMIDNVSTVVERAFLHLNEQRLRFDVAGPFISCTDNSVLDYIEWRKTEAAEDMLWQLISIAASSNGRLRSDEGVLDVASPEMAIVQLLLREEKSGTENSDVPPAATNKIVVENLEEVEDVQISMERIQNLLLKGKRRQAVDEAIACRDFATAMLVASMCDTDTYKRAARAYAERVFVAGSPMQTVSMLFSGCLQSAQRSSHWGIDSPELNSTWKKHLAAIISNRTVGWDRIVLSLGDRLQEIGNVSAAHFCFMVCGCPFKNPTDEGTRIALLGCDHITKSNLALLSEEAIAAYDRTEAYEWAKRRGNTSAVIHSFIPYKLIYASHLTDLDLGEKSVLVSESIRHCAGISGRVSKKGMNLSLKTVFTDRACLCAAMSELEALLGCDEMENVSNLRSDLDGSSAGTKHTSKPEKLKEPTLVMASDGAQQEFVATDKPSHIAKSNNTIADESKTRTEPAPVASNPVGREGDSFLTAKSNLMDVTGYSLDTPEKPPRRAEVSEVSAVAPPLGPAPPMGPPVASTPMSTPIAKAPVGPPSQNKSAPPKFRETGVPMTHATPPRTKEEQPPVPTSHVQLQPVMTPKEPKTAPKKPKSPPATAPPVMMGKKTAKRSDKEAPSSSGQPASGSSWNLGIRDWMIKKLNPDAHAVNLPDNEEKAHFNKELGVWVFPGEDPAELAKPIAPPPIIPKLGTEQPSTPAPPQPASNDPLAQLMAPPPVRGLPSARRPGGPPPRGMPSPVGFSGMPGMPAASPGMNAPPGGGVAPPTFAVFQPKPSAKKDDKAE